MNRIGQRAQVALNLVGLALAAACWWIGTAELAVACGVVHLVALGVAVLKG